MKSFLKIDKYALLTSNMAKEIILFSEKSVLLTNAFKMKTARRIISLECFNSDCETVNIEAAVNLAAISKFPPYSFFSKHGQKSKIIKENRESEPDWLSSSFTSSTNLMNYKSGN